MQLLLQYLFSFIQSNNEVQTKIESHIMSCIRSGLETGRLCDVLNDRISKALGLKTGIFIGIDTGLQCTVAGSGPIFEHYKKTGTIAKHTGFGLKPSTFYDPDFDYAKLRFINYDETFANSPYDASTSNQ